jgi:hypothetical protein
MVIVRFCVESAHFSSPNPHLARGLLENRNHILRFTTSVSFVIVTVRKFAIFLLLEAGTKPQGLVVVTVVAEENGEREGGS